MTTTSKNPVQWLCEKLAEQKDSATNLPYPEEARYGFMFYKVNGIPFLNRYIFDALRRIKEKDETRLEAAFKAAGIYMYDSIEVYSDDLVKNLYGKVKKAGITPSKAENRDALDCLIAFLSKASTPAKKKSKEELERQGRILLKREPGMSVRTLAARLGVSKTTACELDCWTHRPQKRDAGRRSVKAMPRNPKLLADTVRDTKQTDELAKLVEQQQLDAASRRVRD